LQEWKIELNITDIVEYPDTPLMNDNQHTLNEQKEASKALRMHLELFLNMQRKFFLPIVSVSDYFLIISQLIFLGGGGEKIDLNDFIKM
jgi:hypothetical protein